MSPLRVAHVVRHFGGLTEPFIIERVTGDRDDPELWTERLNRGRAPVPLQTIRVPLIRPGTFGDRAFHSVPAIGPILAHEYGRTEAERRPDVVHAHYLTTGWLVGRVTSAPLVVSAYGFDATVMPRRRLWRRAFETLAGRAAAIIVEGPYMRRTLVGLGFDENLVHVVPIAAGFEHMDFRIPNPTNLPLRLVSCGRMVAKKGHEIAIEAFAQSHLPAGSTLAIVGDGPLRSELSGLIDRLRLRESVRLMGSLDRPSWLNLLRGSDILVAASVTAANGDAEGGAPTTILDAQASGVPVVGSTHCDIPFLVSDGITGYLAAEGSAASLADSIRRVHHDRGAWRSIAQAARAQIDARHAGPVVAATLARIHHDVFAGRQ